MNEIKLGIFNIQDSLYNNQNLVARKFCKNNICVLGFKSKRLIIINGVKYKNAIGVAIDANKKEIEVNYSINNTIKIPYGDINYVDIYKEGSDIVVTVK